MPVQVPDAPAEAGEALDPLLEHGAELGSEGHGRSPLVFGRQEHPKDSRAKDLGAAAGNACGQTQHGSPPAAAAQVGTVTVRSSEEMQQRIETSVESGTESQRCHASGPRDVVTLVPRGPEEM